MTDDKLEADLMIAFDPLDFSDLPDIPELAFIEFEKKLRMSLGRPSYLSGLPLRFRENSDNDIQPLRMYVSAIVSFLHVYRIKELDVIDISEADPGAFRSKIGIFVNRVNAFRIKSSLQFRKAAGRCKGTPIQLSADFREEIGKQLEIIRKIIRQEVRNDNKREAIFSRIAALQSEIDRDRTTVDQFFTTLIDMSKVIRECGENIIPLLNKVENVMYLATRGVEGIRKITDRSDEDHTDAIPNLKRA